MLAAWENKNAQCEAVLDSQLLTRDLDQADAWLNARTAMLKDETFLVRIDRSNKENGTICLYFYFQIEIHAVIAIMNIDWLARSGQHS